MRTLLFAGARRCAGIAALLGLAGCHAAAAASAAAVAKSAASSIGDWLAPESAPAAAAPKSPMQVAVQSRARQRAMTVAQQEARRHGWPGVSILDASFDDGCWEISLQRLPRMPNGHAIVQVSAGGELLDFTISDA